MRISDSLIEEIAHKEGIAATELAAGLRRGETVVLGNPRHPGLIPCAVGKSLATKININLGVSPRASTPELEKAKMELAVRLGADSIMDLSLGSDIDRNRRALIASCPVPVGTVPIYQAAYERQGCGGVASLTADDLLEAVRRQAEDGVDFVTVHCGITREALEHVRKDRILGVVSRGGSMLSTWMFANKQENPLYQHYDRLLELAAAYDLTLSLGDGLRPGCVADGSDRAQFEELYTLGDLTRRALERGVRVIVEGPGHLMLHEVQMNMLLQKRACSGVPFYILGPLVTDIAPGYDHITAAIGGAVAAAAGADFLCCVTPAEHLGLPDLKDIEEGVIAGKIAAHAADLAKGHPGARERDQKMAAARRDLDWPTQFALSLNPERARDAYHAKNGFQLETGCTMCGDLCAIRTYQTGAAIDQK
ncbi:MAG: phosphomethylpyrimidine synthase ThiC [Solirubrobacterales bacterium]